MPTKLRPSFRATTAAVPLPTKGSSTMPPGGQPARIGLQHLPRIASDNRSMKSTGVNVGDEPSEEKRSTALDNER